LREYNLIGTDKKSLGMLKNFFFKNKDAKDSTEQDERHALAVILISVARSDWEYTLIEASRIDSILQKRFSITGEEAQKIRHLAEELEEQATDLVRFTKIVKKFVPLEQRTDIIEVLWEVVLTDGVRDDGENSLLRMLGPLLGVTDREIAFSRQKVNKTFDT
jgi:uncharacterized tellurite resistance protein B-like protein